MRKSQEPYAMAAAVAMVLPTPVGMYPNNGKTPLDLARFKDLEGVMDVIYNPLRTALLMQAEELGVPCTNGLTMLVAQAKAAAEYFLGKKIPDNEKKKRAERFKRKNEVSSVQKEALTAERYGQNRSNLLRVLSQFEELQYKE